MIALQVAVFLVGAVLVLVVSLSALRTFVLPRDEQAHISRVVFRSTRKVFDLRARMASTYEGRDRVMAFYAPMALVLVVATWMLLVIAGFAAMLWASSERSWGTAFAVSGSSVTTLGMDHPAGHVGSALAVVEAAIGLGLVALVISYFPSIYASFQRRELAVSLLEVRAGNPPNAVDLLVRHHRIGSEDRLRNLFADWEVWFSDVEETHTTLAVLCFFRSPLPSRSWVTAAGAVLDTASIVQSTLDIERVPEAALCIRAGYLTLRRIADVFNVDYDPEPDPGGPIAIAREEYDEVCQRLEAEGVALRPDRDAAWLDFRGWRVNYDKVLIAMAGVTMAPYAPWSSDRSVTNAR